MTEVQTTPFDLRSYYLLSYQRWERVNNLLLLESSSVPSDVFPVIAILKAAFYDLLVVLRDDLILALVVGRGQVCMAIFARCDDDIKRSINLCPSISPGWTLTWCCRRDKWIMAWKSYSLDWRGISRKEIILGMIGEQFWCKECHLMTLCTFKTDIGLRKWKFCIQLFKSDYPNQVWTFIQQQNQLRTIPKDLPPKFAQLSTEQSLLLTL